METVETHPFEPFVPDDPEILIMGTFPPQPKRWSMEFYYPNWSNDFWRICGLIFYGDKDHFCDVPKKTFRLEEIKEFLRRRHIAMSDTGREAIRLKDNASDKFLDIRKAIPIADFLRCYPTIHTLVTTGEKAAQTIAELTDTEAPRMGTFAEFSFDGRRIRHWRMPSTSRAYPSPLATKAALYAKVLATNPDF